METEYICGKMEEDIMDNGKTMIWRALVYIYGVMEEGLKGNITMIKRVALEYTTGQMEEDMKDGGLRESNMDLAHI